jgi:two-component system OmpR family response regulator
VRLLLIEDNLPLSDVLVRALQQSGYIIDVARTIKDAEAWLSAQEYELVILDLGLPDGDGASIVRRCRARRQSVPVLVLSAREAVDERVRLLNLGADDYLVKSGAIDELEARIRALVRRSRGASEPEITVGKLRLDLNGRRAFNGTLPLDLNSREWSALAYLAARAGRIVSKEQLMSSLYGWEEANSVNAVEKVVSRLRSKLRESDVTVRSIRGLGYSLETTDGS